VRAYTSRKNIRVTKLEFTSVKEEKLYFKIAQTGQKTFTTGLEWNRKNFTTPNNPLSADVDYILHL